MNKKFKKVILVILVFPLLLLWILATVLANIFSEFEDWSSENLDRVGRWFAKKLNILE